MNIQKQIIEELVEKNNQRVNEVLKKALSFKGYDFKTESDLSIFISKNCRKEINQFHTDFFVKDVLFLKHTHPTEVIKLETDYENDFKIDFNIDFGSYEII